MGPEAPQREGRRRAEGSRPCLREIPGGPRGQLHAGTGWFETFY